MEVAIVVVLLVGLFVWANSRKAKSSAKRELRYFEYADGDWSFSVDFLTMRGESSAFRDFTGDPLFDNEKPTAVHLRRISSSKWQTKVTEVSCGQQRAQIAALRKDAVDEEDHANLDERLKRLEKWQAISGEIVGPLETGYQKYLLHGEDS